MSKYFSYLPDVYVRTSSYRTDSVDPYVLAKNLFRRIKIRDNIDDMILGFNQYTIQNNERVEQVAFKLYDDSQYDWVILLVNNIINVYEEWPMDEHELYNFCVRKYGEKEVEAIHHYETLAVRDSKGRVVLREGRQVPKDFRYTRPDGTVVPSEDFIVPITNYEFEAKENDYKRNIYTLRKEYLYDFIEEFEKLVEYLDSAEVDTEDGTKKTIDAVEEAFITVKPKYETNIGQTSTIEFASSQEYGTKTFTLKGDGTVEEGDVLADGSTVVRTSDPSASTNQYGSSTVSDNLGAAGTTSTTTTTSSSGSSSGSSGSSGSGSSGSGY